ncbi:TRAP transporter small permease [Chelativorans sp. Marseille-P2723]|uniref:TRAP transporter small permease n=1 Tax=Chelativorans sp. Marseille-P2723 TaxID=2709133 RepID=UPI00156E47F8|nr:TRAP transporter small permease [Chelativorans sp. Marseille-P2723]
MSEAGNSNGVIPPLLSAVDKVNWAIGYFMAGALAVMVFCTMLQVTVRFLLTKFGILLSVPWSEELARYLMIWIVFIGSAVAARKGQLIALEFLVETLPSRIAYPVRILALLVSLAFFALLVWTGWRYTMGNLIERSPVMVIPMSWVYASLPVSAALMIINTLCLIVDETLHGHRPVLLADTTLE